MRRQGSPRAAAAPYASRRILTALCYVRAMARDDSSERTPRRILVWLEDAEVAIEEGRLEEAARALANVRRKRPDLPELAFVEGDLALAEGDVDRAIERYGEAAARDPEWPEARIAMGWAELEQGDVEAASEIADDAVERWGDDPVVAAEALMLAASARLADEDLEGAAARLSEVEALEPSDPELLFDLAEGWHALGRPDHEEKAYRAIIALDPGDPDALYGLGGCLHERGAREEATRAWLRVRELDLAEPRPERPLTESELEEVAERALRELPEHVRERLANVPILVEDLPSEELVREGVDPRLLGLFTGTPLPQKTHLEGSPTSPDAAILYLRNLESAFADREELIEQVRVTILHETAHFFGLEDEDLEELGLG